VLHQWVMDNRNAFHKRVPLARLFYNKLSRTPVMPAKAGIQHWIPAFAGMSGKATSAPDIQNEISHNLKHRAV
jgi:hypothetical protein